jgi:hypothetical protein
MSKHQRKHHVMSHAWVGGILATVSQVFENLEEAMAFAKTVDVETVKIYDEDGQLVHSATGNATTTYA